MAAIDKIYGTQSQYLELKKWLEENYQEATYWLYSEDDYPIDERPISNFPQVVDEWLLENCPIDWVVDYIKYQYALDEEE